MYDFEFSLVVGAILGGFILACAIIGIFQIIIDCIREKRRREADKRRRERRLYGYYRDKK